MGNEKRPSTTDPTAVEIVEAPTDDGVADAERPADKVGPIARPTNGGGRTSTAVGRKIRNYVN